MQALVSQHLYDFQTIDFPGEARTQVFGTNDFGVIAGEYGDAQDNGHGFTYSKKDGYKTVDFPGAVQTGAFSINNLGSVVGIYVDTSGVQHGFLMTGNHFVSLDVPGAVDTNALGINDLGDVVGVYDTVDPATHIGFLLRKGHYTTIDILLRLLSKLSSTR